MTDKEDMEDDTHPEMGRFQPRGNPNEPREPFLDNDQLEEKFAKEPPSVHSLHIPQAPLSGKKLKMFLIEVRPCIEQIQSIKREEQHILAKHLQSVRKLVHESDLAKKITPHFDKLVDHYNELLTHSTPQDAEAVLEEIDQIEQQL